MCKMKAGTCRLASGLIQAMDSGTWNQRGFRVVVVGYSGQRGQHYKERGGETVQTLGTTGHTLLLHPAKD